MKKLLVAIFCLLTFSSFSQSSMYSYKNQIGRWDEYSKEWNWEKAEYTDITFTLGKTYITCNDEAKSFYKIFEDLGDDNTIDYKSHGWKCTDEKGRTCLVNMVLYKKYNFVVIHVMYKSTAIRYYITKKGEISELD